VEPKRDCPHVHGLKLSAFKKNFSIEAECEEEGCHATGENWICCFCGKILCSRYVAGHAAQHAEKNPDHCISVSFADCSCWCYKCDSYIEDPISVQFVRCVQRNKFGLPPEPKMAAVGEDATAFVSPFVGGEDSVVNKQEGASIDLQDALPSEGVRFEECSDCTIDVQSRIRVLRLYDCKKCTVRVNAAVGGFDIQRCSGVIIRSYVSSARSCIIINDSAAVTLLMDGTPMFDFFRSFESTGSIVGIKFEEAKTIIPAGPHSKTTFNAETSKFETKPCE